MVCFLKTAKSVTMEDMKSVEKRLRITIPEDLKALYFKANGGKVVENCFEKDGRKYHIHDMLPMLYGDGDGVEETYEDLVLDNDLFPDDIMPFAADAFGDYFVYSLQNGSMGAILFTESDYNEDGSLHIVKLADSLEEFLSSLKKDDADD